MSLRFLHSADWQLGKPFANIQGDTAALLRQARFGAIERLAEIAQARSADAVLVAGDVFDSRFPDARTLHAAARAMRGYRGPWVLLPGNHDPAEGTDLWSRFAKLAGDLRLELALEPAPILLADGALCVLPAPLRQRHGFEDASGWMDTGQSPAGAVRVGLAHGSVQQFGEREPAANPIAPDRARTARLDYLALGDWHGLTRIDERSYYSGTPEPDGFADNEPGKALWVEIDGPGAVPRVEILATAAYRWRRLVLDDVAGAASAIQRVEHAIADAERPDRLLLWLSLAGNIDLAGRLELAAALEDWQARLAHLRLQDELRDTPSDADLAALAGGSGVVAGTAQILLAHADEAAARLALRHLFELARGEG